MANSVSESLEYALEPRIISCVAGAWASGDSYCLPLHTSVDIINAINCRVIVAHMHRIRRGPATLSSTFRKSWGIVELADKLATPLENYVFFLNTALCANEAEVMELVTLFEQLNKLPPYSRYRERFLKLEIFDEKNRPKDEETCNILRHLPSHVLHSCLPYLSGHPRWLQAAIEMGCPAIRIWCSDIGKEKGLTDEARLKNAVSLSTVPLILEGGLATPQDVRRALEMGFDGVLLNSAFRNANDPVALASEIRKEVNLLLNSSRESQNTSSDKDL